MNDTFFSRLIRKILILYYKRGNSGDKSAINYEKAKIIGIIYNRSIRIVETTAANLIENMETDRKKVFSIEYVAGINDTEYKLKEKNHFALRKEDINYFKLPKKGIRETFCIQDFDILINFSYEDIPELHYLASMCSAKMKVGISNEIKTSIYDITIQPKGSSDFKELANFTMNQLKKINKK